MSETAIVDNKKGSLIIAGSGIASVGHITLETLGHIKAAERVYYAVGDSVTEAFILDNAKGTCSDLRVFYDKDKDRYDTYTQMSEVMLRDVRAGFYVLGIFYGHPGVFVSPSHRAIAIARAEGYPAKLLPGISAEDYLFADLEIDPAVPGCVTYEANELLMRNKRLDPTIHNIIWQVGTLGVGDMQFNNSKFHMLVDYLEQIFGKDHKVVNYIGAVLPHTQSMMEMFTIADLRKDEVVKKFNPTSTMYIPPRDESPVIQIVQVGLTSVVLKPPAAEIKRPFPPPKWAGPSFDTAPAYGPREAAAIAQIDHHVVPKEHTILRASPAMMKFTTSLALDTELSNKFVSDPTEVVDATKGLTKSEQIALKTKNPGAIERVMRGTTEDIASGRQPTDEELGAVVPPPPPPPIIVVIVLV